ncbi:MAG: hypothetical protein JW779_15360 [Candidatus Thorarchaeota archaeon]|nr:hypothetical protein [Candidatus Thorarchaeota archaeon]
MEYKKLKETELFSFFHFTETGRRYGLGGLTEIHLKPGGFQEFIDITLKVDRSDGVHEGVLYLDRDWIGSAMTVNPFGKDLAKSFVEAVTHPADKEKASKVVSTIWGLTGIKDQVIRISENETTEEVPIQKLSDVYTGIEKCYSLNLDKSRILVENILDVGRNRLKIEISSVEEENQD